MPKLDLTDLSSLANETSFLNALNNNSQKIEEALENTLSRDGKLPNHMEDDLDLNTYRAINVGKPLDNTDAATKEYVDLAISSLALVSGVDGVVPISQPRQVADGVTNIFASPATGNQNVNSFQVFVNGVRLRPQNEFTYDSSNGTIVLASPPASGSNVDVSFFNPSTEVLETAANSISAATYTVLTGETTVSVAPYFPNTNTQLYYLNNVPLFKENGDIVESSTTTVTLTQAPTDSSTLTVLSLSLKQIGVADSENISHKSTTLKEALDNLAVDSLAELAAIDGEEGQSARINLGGRAGPFRATTADISTEVTNDPQQGVYVAFASDPTGASGGWVRQYVGAMYAEWFGATGAGAAIEDSALQGLTSFVSSGDDVEMPGHYRIQTKLEFPAGVDVNISGKITSEVSSGTAVSIGNRDTFQTIPAKIRIAEITRDTESDFSDIDDVGIEIINVANAEIEIGRVVGFTVGTRLHGDTSTSSTDRGVSWNQIYIGEILSCLIGVDHKRTNGGGGIAFVNENEIHRGRFLQRNSVATAATTLPAYVGSGKIKCYAFQADGVNGNTWRKPDITLDHTRSGDGQVFDGYGWKLTDCTRNEAISVRFEFSTAVAELDGTSGDNVFRVLYSDPSAAPVLVDTSDRRTNVVLVGDDTAIERFAATWDSGPLSKKTTNWNASSFAIPGVGFANINVHTEPTIQSNNAGYKSLPDYIQSLGGLALVWRLDTSRKKRFIVRREVVTGNPGRITISARKADGTQWTDVDPDAPYVFSDRTIAFNGASNLKGWAETADFDGDLFFAVRDDVDHVYVCIAGGTAPLKLKRLAIISEDCSAPEVSSAIPGYDDSQRIGQVSPVIGWFYQGQVVHNTNAAAAQPSFWKCQVSGWATGTAWAGSTAYSADDIVYNGSNAYLCVTAGTSASSGGPTGTGSGIADGTVVWDYIAPRATFRSGPVMP